MSILCIGNSHLACIKEAWTSPAQTVDYICGTGYKFFDSLAVDKTAETLSLVSDADERLKTLWAHTYGRPATNLSGYSMVIVVGLGDEVSPWALSNCSEKDPVKINELSPHPPVSFSLWREINNIRYRLGRMRIIKNLLVKAGAPKEHIYFIKIPLPRTEAGEYNAKYSPPASWGALTEDEKALLLENEQLLHDRACKLHGVQCLPLPAVLREDGGYCPSQYSIGSLGSLDPATGKPKNWGDSPEDSIFNIKHKNIEYGKVWVEVLESLYHTHFDLSEEQGNKGQLENAREAAVVRD